MGFSSLQSGFVPARVDGDAVWLTQAEIRESAALAPAKVAELPLRL
jgi:hypothetical protein